MRIYHGSIVKVEKPEIRESNRTLDYGQGFYTTTSYEQAEAWVKRRMDEKKCNKGYVCVYELNDDRVYAAFALYEGGLINKQALIVELKAYKLVDQYLFHTQRALEALRFIEAKEVIR